MRRRVIIGQGGGGGASDQERSDATHLGREYTKVAPPPGSLSRARDTLIEETAERTDRIPHNDTTDSPRRLAKA